MQKIKITNNKIFAGRVVFCILFFYILFGCVFFEVICNAAYATEKNLYGRRIFIDPGHQRAGNDAPEAVAPAKNTMSVVPAKPKVTPGTRGVKTGKWEYELNLEVALLLKKMLEDIGAEVFLSRETHDVDVSNQERAEAANTRGADVCVRLHADWNSDERMRGFWILVPGDKYITDAKLISRSRWIGERVEARMKEILGAPSRGVVPRGDMTGFNWSRVPVILVEMGFMSNPREDVLLSTPAYQARIARAICRGLQDCF